MDLDDFVEPEVGVAVALTAAVLSPRVRHYLRKGLVYGLAGVLSVTDAAKEVASGVKRGVKSVPAAPEAVPGHE